MYYRVLLRIARYGHVMPCIVMCYHVFQYTAIYYGVLLFITMYGPVLQGIAMYYHV